MLASAGNLFPNHSLYIQTPTEKALKPRKLP